LRLAREPFLFKARQWTQQRRSEPAPVRRVSESPFSKNQPWPDDRTRRPSNQPALGLQLHYLITPLGVAPNDSSFSEGDDAHTMLGLAMLTLQENPILNNAHLPALPASGSLNATPGFDADAVLPNYLLNSFEQIKIMLSPVSVDELSKIWATINQPYRLSVAYEVSLVELTPTLPPPMNGGIVLRTGLDVVPLMAPQLDSLKPSTGALVHVDGAGTLQPNTIAISGGGFSFPGQTPSVTVGGQPVAVKVTSPPDSSLVVTLPTDLDAGPQADVRVTLNGRSSTPLTFTVTPWLATAVPVRTGLPANQRLTLQGIGFSATPNGVRLETSGAPATLIAFDPGVTDKQGTITIPPALANGIYQVRIVLSDSAQSASSSRTLEVAPRIDSATLALSSPPAAETLTVNGARLSGSDIRILLDGVTYQGPPNANATKLVFAFNRAISPGSHALSVSIDGHMSHTVDLEA
jgi:Pvc16 N-terminal domain/IPT/TIG domain